MQSVSAYSGYIQALYIQKKKKKKNQLDIFPIVGFFVVFFCKIWEMRNPNYNLSSANNNSCKRHSIICWEKLGFTVHKENYRTSSATIYLFIYLFTYLFTSANHARKEGILGTGSLWSMMLICCGGWGHTSGFMLFSINISLMSSLSCDVIPAQFSDDISSSITHTSGYVLKDTNG